MCITMPDLCVLCNDWRCYGSESKDPILVNHQGKDNFFLVKAEKSDKVRVEQAKLVHFMQDNNIDECGFREVVQCIFAGGS